MIVQEDVPYTKEEVKAMVNTIHDLREKVSQLGWHPASELPPLDKDGGSGLVYALCKVFSKEYGEYLDKVLYRVRVMHGKWEPEDIEVEWWCYPPKEE